MSEHGHEHEQPQLSAEERRPLGERAWPIYRNAFIAGALGLLVALLTAMFVERGWVRFGHAYIAAYAYFLSIALGCLCFVSITHVCRAGWSVVVRRPAELAGAAMPTLAALFVPILVFVLVNDGAVFPWAQPLPEDAPEAQAMHDAAPESEAQVVLTGAEGAGADEGAATQRTDNPPGAEPVGAHVREVDTGYEHGEAEFWYLVENKRPYLNTPFFVLRWIVYLGVWTLGGLWLWRLSVRQDETGDPRLTRWLEIGSAPLFIALMLTITFAAFDLLKSLDPTWYSSIFGVYYGAGAFMGAMAALILVFMALQKAGYARSVTAEHYHDLGKLLFAFVFFWGYVAYSQYMLYWYGNVTGELGWMTTHGLSTAHPNPWSWWALLLLFGHLLLPFAGLLSRHAKRNGKVLAFWAIWLLIFHWLDVHWLVMPEFTAERIVLGLMEVAAMIGVGGIFLGTVVRLAAQHSLVPTQDPRLAESLAHRNH